jgi:hypothetical protein
MNSGYDVAFSPDGSACSWPAATGKCSSGTSRQGVAGRLNAAAWEPGLSVARVVPMGRDQVLTVARDGSVMLFRAPPRTGPTLLATGQGTNYRVCRGLPCGAVSRGPPGSVWAPGRSVATTDGLAAHGRAVAQPLTERLRRNLSPLPPCGADLKLLVILRGPRPFVFKVFGAEAEVAPHRAPGRCSARGRAPFDVELSIEQHVAVPEMKLSIVDVKCMGRRARFVVESGREGGGARESGLSTTRQRRELAALEISFAVRRRGRDDLQLKLLTSSEQSYKVPMLSRWRCRSVTAARWGSTECNTPSWSCPNMRAAGPDDDRELGLFLS